MSSATDRSKKMKTDSDQIQNLEDNMLDQCAISKLNDDCLEKIFSYLPFKDRIKIQRVCKIWQAVSESSCRNIKSIGLGSGLFNEKFKSKPEKVLLPIFAKILASYGNNLETIGLGNSLSISNLELLKLVKKSCPKLQSISFFECNIALLKYLIENFTNLLSISFEYCYQNCEKLLSEYFSKNKVLDSFDIERNEHLTGSFLLNLPETVETLSIRLCKKITPENIANAVQKLTKLKSLALSGDFKFMEKINTILQRIPMNSTIESLDISFFTVKHCNKFIDQLKFHSLTNLRELNLDGNILVDDGFLAHVAEHCKQLVKVSLEDAQYVNDWGLETFAKSLNLDYLFISNSKLMDARYMTSVKNLTYHCCHYLEEYSMEYLIKDSKVLESLSVFFCEEIRGKELIEKALKAHTRDEFLDVNYMDRDHDIIEARVKASRLQIIKDTSKCLAIEFREKLL